MQYAAAVSLWWPVNKHGCRHFAHLMKYLATENDTAVHKTTVQYIHRCLEKSGLSLGETFLKNVQMLNKFRLPGYSVLKECTILQLMAIISDN